MCQKPPWSLVILLAQELENGNHAQKWGQICWKVFNCPEFHSDGNVYLSNWYFRGMCNFGITIFRMGNLLHFFISLFYFFMLFPWIPRTLIDGLILSSNTSVENWKWFIRHTSWLSSDLISKEIYDCETKKETKKRQKTRSKRRIRLICIEITNVRWTPFDLTFYLLVMSYI